MSTLKMHRYVIGWTGLFIAFGVTLPIAMSRVSNTKKFVGQPFNSLTCEGQLTNSRAVVEFPTCAQMQVQPIANASVTQPAVQPMQAVNKSQLPAESPDPFLEAFRIAEQAVAKGQTAKTAVDWHGLAPQWQQAADFMRQIPPDDPRYAIAQHRVKFYQQNRQAVLKQAERTLPW
jgi:hypothetical protein